MICIFALAAPLGFILSDLVLSGLSEASVGIAAAFTGGSLLYIATADLLPVIHSTTKNRYLSALFFVFGILIMSLFASHSGHVGHEEERMHKEMHADE